LDLDRKKTAEADGEDELCARTRAGHSHVSRHVQLLWVPLAEQSEPV